MNASDSDMDSIDSDMGSTDASINDMDSLDVSIMEDRETQPPSKKKRRKRHRIPGTVCGMKEEERVSSIIRTAIKWHYLLHFNTNEIRECVEKAVPEIANDQFRMDSYDVDSAKYLTGCKSETHSRMKVRLCPQNVCSYPKDVRACTLT